MRESQLREIYDRTKGHCHFCGDPVLFEMRGWALDLDGYWEVDHLIQRGKGGSKATENCLPACTRCNRLRWHRTGDAVRELLLLGLIARDEITKRSNTGIELLRLREKRLAQNAARRASKASNPATQRTGSTGR